MTRVCELCGDGAWTGVEIRAFRPVETFQTILCHDCFQSLREAAVEPPASGEEDGE